MEPGIQQRIRCFVPDQIPLGAGLPPQLMVPGPFLRSVSPQALIFNFLMISRPSPVKAGSSPDCNTTTIPKRAPRLLQPGSPPSTGSGRLACYHGASHNKCSYSTIIRELDQGHADGPLPNGKRSARSAALRTAWAGSLWGWAMISRSKFSSVRAARRVQLWVLCKSPGNPWMAPPYSAIPKTTRQGGLKKSIVQVCITIRLLEMSDVRFFIHTLWNPCTRFSYHFARISCPKYTIGPLTCQANNRLPVAGLILPGIENAGPASRLPPPTPKTCPWAGSRAAFRRIKLGKPHIPQGFTVFCQPRT